MTTPVYAAPGLRSLTSRVITCGVFLHLTEEEVEIRTLADEIKLATDAAQEVIGRELRLKLPKVPVFYGSPKINPQGLGAVNLRPPSEAE